MTVIGTFDSLAEAAKLTQSVLLPGVIQQVINVGQMLPRLPVTQLDGYSMKYNREILPSEGQFLDIGEQVASDADVTFTQVEVFLKRYIKQHDLDHFIMKTWGNINDVEAQAIMTVAKGVTEGLEGQLIYSSNAVNTKAFDSLHTLVTSAQTIHQGSSATGAALSLANLDKAIDLVRPRPDWILMNRALWRRLSQTIRGGTTSYPLYMAEIDPVNGMGRRAMFWDAVEIIPSDYITMTETISASAYAAKTGGATSTIFLGRNGQLTEGGLCMLMGNPLFEPIKIENLENKDATRYRMVSYLAPALGATVALAAIDGITDVAMVA